MPTFAGLKKRLDKKSKHNIYSHNSLHIWYSSNNTTEIQQSDLEMDLNVWKLKKSSDRITYIDFGLNVTNPLNINKIFVYFPFKMKGSRFADLGSCLTDVELLNGIFNDKYSVASSNKWNIVSDRETQKQIFAIYRLDVKSDVSFEDNYGGTIISFTVKNTKGNIPAYYRFRINPEKETKSSGFGSFFHEYRPNQTFFQSAFNVTEITDFRINEERNQDKTLKEKIDTERSFNIKEIRFFHISPTIDVLVGESQLQYQRQLESDGFWANYLMCGHSFCDDMCVYRCKKTVSHTERISDFHIFYKIERRKSNWVTLMKYGIVSIVIATLLDLISAWINNCVLWVVVGNFLKKLFLGGM